MKKGLTCLSLVLILTVFYLSLNIPSGQCATSITYNPGINTIIVVGNYSNLHEEIWNADKTGTFTLVDRRNITAIDNSSVPVNASLRPTDEVLLGGEKNDIEVKLLGFFQTNEGGTIEVNGTNEADNVQVENITMINTLGVPAIQLTNYTFNLYKTLVSTRVVDLIGGSIDWNYTITQGQWGCIWKTGEQHYKIDNTIIRLGDSSSVTVCSDVNVNVLFETNQRWGYQITSNAELTFGNQDSEHATSQGVTINWNSSYGSTNTGIFYGSSSASSKLNLYSCSLKAIYNNTPESYVTGIVYFSGTNQNVVIYNCFFDKVFSTTAYVEIYNLAIFRNLYGLCGNGDYEQIFLYDIRYAISLNGPSKTLKDVNIIAVDSLTGVRYTGGGNDHYLINVDWAGASNWLFYWHNGPFGDIFRQYEFDLTVTYPNGTAINGTQTGARVLIQHYGNNSAVDYNATLNDDGTINTTILSMGYYNQTGGNTLYTYNPFSLTVSNVTGYNTYTKNFTLSEKTAWEITLSSESENIPYMAPFFFLGLLISIVIGALLFTKK